MISAIHNTRETIVSYIKGMFSVLNKGYPCKEKNWDLILKFLPSNLHFCPCTVLGIKYYCQRILTEAHFMISTFQLRNERLDRRTFNLFLTLICSYFRSSLLSVDISDLLGNLWRQEHVFLLLSSVSNTMYSQRKFVLKNIFVE